MSTRIEYQDRVIWVNEDEQLHRLDGPAIELNDGTKSWHLNGKRHREDGPAIEYNYGDKVWYIKGELHREDGPAVELKDGSKEWYLNDIEYTEQEYNKEMIKIRFKRIENL